ncbi:Nitrogen regulatory protein P-II family protein [Desulfamplus magnetovallimortis]|uniref:Nitrogen regulatory protein P-II family protein n=1 Tax=Desulfamplus magnetovallimortis TaxID=1246637 RepID=A0A1W1HL90_9BACT|nr:P-II family nitrogen regulator [Desulfamplus magnetovallimortis]SLM33244.1 Nitrogen regulatory protein P-II family protein [Desulfamplus magnetovallimortis]
MKFKMILSSVKPDITDNIVDSAKAAGATGATIIPARGTGIREAKTFFGLTLEAQTDIIMFLVEEHLVDKILAAIKEAGQFHKPGTGIAFVLPVEQVAGLESQLDEFKKRVKETYF